MPSNYNGRGGHKKSDGKIADKFREACPPHKVKDLDALVKQCKGDEEKIQSTIMEWWEEPQVAEPEWEAVDRKSTKKATEKKPSGGGGRNDRGSKSSAGGGGERRGDRFNGGREGGRGARERGEGRGGRPGGRSDRDRGDRRGDRAAAQKKSAQSAPAQSSAPAPKQDTSAAVDIPTPVTAAPTPKGAWGGATSFANIAAAPAPKRAAPQPVPPPEPQQPEVSVPLEQEQVTMDLDEPVTMLSPEDPTPSGLPTPSALAPAASTSGNVWGAKGGAHLIAAAKAKPIPTPAPAPTMIEPEAPELVVEEHLPEHEQEEALINESSFGVSLDGVLPASVNGANINASGWEPILDASETAKSSVEISQPSPVGPIAVGTSSSLPEPEPVPLSQPAAAVPVAAAPAGVKPSNVLNMGHWETGDDNDGELDFGFGSFAPESDDAAVESKTSQAPPSATETASAPAPPQPSPTRPPPGLSMPGMPAGATFVHELETKLENTTLAQKTEDKAAPETKTAPSQPQSLNSGLPGQMNSAMPQYGGMGMYGMPPGVPSALGTMPQFPNAPNLGGAMSQQQPKNDATSQGQQQPGPYGMMQSNTNTANNTSGAPGNDNNSNSTNNATMPPGMPGMQYPNPAFMYGQYNHPYGMQYGYGQQFGQFGGYSQVMGQGGGYPYGGPSHHDDRNRGGNMRDNYQKGGRGGYRGNRNNHHQNNQYGNNYQGMGGGYGAAPAYNMGYGHGGGYQPSGPSGMDHYGMQQGGFNHQNNDHNKGKSSQPDGNQQFQQQGQLQQQPLGLQGSTNDTNTGGSGWSSGGGGAQNWGGNWQRDN